MARTRRRRSDRNFIIYQLTHLKSGQIYIGISAVLGRAVKYTLQRRFNKHVSKALCAGKKWRLHRVMRKHPEPEHWDQQVLEVVRGKKATFRRERDLIKQHAPSLNSF